VTVSVLPTELATSALVAMLRAATASLSAVMVYDHRIPPAGVSTPYGLVLAVDSPDPDGPPWSDDEADATLTFQLDAVGKRRDQAQWLADRLRAAVLGRTGPNWTNAVSVSGWVSADRRTTGQYGRVDREGSPRFELYVARAQYELAFTPA